MRRCSRRCSSHRTGGARSDITSLGRVGSQCTDQCPLYGVKRRFIDYNSGIEGGIGVHCSLFNMVLHDQPQIKI